jgi:hypothetical protein
MKGSNLPVREKEGETTWEKEGEEGKKKCKQGYVISFAKVKGMRFSYLLIAN